MTGPVEPVEKDTLEIISSSPAETIRTGRCIGAALKGGEVVGLTGPLGSGKTHLIKGIAEGAGAADANRISSPTFVIVNEYLATGAGLDVYHIDAYRIESIAEFEMLGFDEFCRPDSVVVIEWADKVAAALRDIDLIQIELFHIDRTHRRIVLRNAPGSFKVSGTVSNIGT